MRLTSLVVLLIVVSFMAACDDDTHRGGEGARSSAPGGTGPELIASCGGAVLDRLPPDTSAFEPFDSFDELELSRLDGEAPYFLRFADDYEWFVTQEGQGWRQILGMPLTEGRDPPYASLRIELRDGRWAPDSWGQCRIEIAADGWGNARFVVDPATPPDPESDRIAVLATEGTCASGQAPEGREVRAVIHGRDRRTVSIVILVEPTKGDASCQGNPAFPFEVELGSPLGNREILDASIFPAESQWP
jgi:hypothetical protein